MDTHYDIVRLATVPSTQDEARNRAADGGAPTLVVTTEQTAGRGRQSRVWTQPDRGMFTSLAFVSEWAAPDRTLLPLVAAVAMRRVIADRYGAGVDLKWPNDLMIQRKKVGGILVEASDNSVVVGCGINLWWADPIEGAISLLDEDPGTNAASRLAESWAGSFLALIEDGAQRWPRTEYEQASITLGSQVYWDDHHGRAIGIASDGALIVDKEGVVIELRSGEVHTHDHR
jgi:BirA family biotin operon repressor/biotin-[acetyl-CoA-carboxylase] ligase